MNYHFWNIHSLELSKNKMRLMDTDRALVVTMGNGGREEVERSEKGQIFSNGRKSNFGR